MRGTEAPLRLLLALRAAVKKILPRGLFGRTLLIVVTPTLLTLCVATFVFFDRHWFTVSQRLTQAAAGDIALVMDLMAVADGPEKEADVARLAERRLDLRVTCAADAPLPEFPRRFPNPLRPLLEQALKEKGAGRFALDWARPGSFLGVHVRRDAKTCAILLPRRRISTPTTQVFIGWMAGSAILLSVVALLFMRNQVRPIRRLAEAAEAIGKGQDVPWLKPEGAAEVRQAASAVLGMRDRLRRQMAQRTAMLAGVSHDLRTPLTRMKLQLALMPESEATEELVADIAEMETMVDAYLAFARGEEAEPAAPADMAELLGEVVAAARRQNPDVALDAPQGVVLSLRRNALRRCFGNLLGNALRHGQRAEVTLRHDAKAVEVLVDDDGPGIPPERREEVFRPFLRLDESRSSGTGGVGLGLTIARDIARFHGGDVVLETSPLGGLRARVWLPV